MLELKVDREPALPKDAATLVLVRASAADVSAPPNGNGIEVFCVERNRQSRFMGGATVFPGGKLDGSDLLAEWTPLTTPPRVPPQRTVPFTSSDAHLRSLAIAAARETLEEAAVVHVRGGTVAHDDLLALRDELEQNPDALRVFLAKAGLQLDLAALHPFARWITPEAEPRRFDTRFFIAVAPEGQTGAHDDRETVSSLWTSPALLLRRFEAGEVQLMPPTHRTLALLEDCVSTDAALALADASCLDPICPRLVPHEDSLGQAMALVLPGDPEHDVRDVRVPGRSRYVLRGDQWRPEDPPR